MGVKFLSEEWTRAVEDRLNASEAFRSAAAGRTAAVQQVVTGPEGEQRYWFKLQGDRASLGVGTLPESVDATITQDYATAAAISRAELSPMAAYMSGKLKISGNLMKLMQLQGVLGQLPAALKDLEVEY